MGNEKTSTIKLPQEATKFTPKELLLVEAMSKIPANEKFRTSGLFGGPSPIRIMSDSAGRNLLRLMIMSGIVVKMPTDYRYIVTDRSKRVLEEMARTQEWPDADALRKVAEESVVLYSTLPKKNDIQDQINKADINLSATNREQRLVDCILQLSDGCTFGCDVAKGSKYNYSVGSAKSNFSTIIRVFIMSGAVVKLDRNIYALSKNGRKILEQVKSTGYWPEVPAPEAKVEIKNEGDENGQSASEIDGIGTQVDRSFAGAKT